VVVGARARTLDRLNAARDVAQFAEAFLQQLVGVRLAKNRPRDGERTRAVLTISEAHERMI
jgi:hypothetical protein